VDKKLLKLSRPVLTENAALIKCSSVLFHCNISFRNIKKEKIKMQALFFIPLNVLVIGAVFRPDCH